MNDLMTKSFLSYVELKKQALKDQGQDVSSSPDLETGLTQVEERNLSLFFEEVSGIQSEMEDISNLLIDLRQLNNETESVHSAKVLRGLRDRMDSDMHTILRKAKVIKARLEALDRSNIANRSLLSCFGEGGPVDRTRISITNGLRIKLREMMIAFQSLRENIVAEHREELKRRYFNTTGEEATEETVEKMLRGTFQANVMTQKGDGESEMIMQERQRRVSEIQRSLMQLHQVFLDMAVMIEAQEQQLNDIEVNVVKAKEYISGGTDRLVSAKALNKTKKKWTSWVFILMLIVLVVCLIPLLTGS